LSNRLSMLCADLATDVSQDLIANQASTMCAFADKGRNTD